MTTLKSGSDVNLKELRSLLTARVALFLLLGGSLTMWAFLPLYSLSLSAFILPALLVGLGGAVRKLNQKRPLLARHLLLWGLTAALLAAMWTFSAAWIPFLGVTLLFLAAMLVWGGALATGGLVAVLTTWLAHSGARAYPLPELLPALAFGLTLAWLATDIQNAALEWAWTMQQEANRLLELARDRQGELARTLKSLDLANSILRRTQRELVFARRQAEETQRMKEQFAANVSHELRTPLNLILGFSELMHLSPEVYGEMTWPPALRQDVYQIYRSSRHLLDMINDVLDLSRFEMVGFTLERELTPLEPFLRDTAEIVGDLFRERPVRLELAIEDALPALEIDRTRVRQVLLNLVNNAARFAERGAVRITARQADGEVQISVSDTGPGIPAEKLAHIFEEFYQVAPSLSRKPAGAGLGLAICRHFVQAHDGRIWAESEVGHGSTFTFTLPIPGQYVPVSGLLATQPIAQPASEPAMPLLVVDPDPAVASLVARHVEGYPVVQIADAQQLAAEVLLRHPRAVILNVPPRDGDAAPGKSIADSLPPVPCVECSLPSRAWLAAEQNLTASLTKPVSAADLLSVIGRLGDVRDVLVVDDDRGFCQLVERMLKANGGDFNARQAYDAADGLAQMRTQRPDLVLLDLIMPDMDGFQMMREMRRDPALAKVPVALVTAADLAEEILLQRSSQIVVRRPDGLRLVEVLRCLEAIVGALAPRYDERSIPALTPPPTA
ncbi:MAG: hypothetical protein AUK03_16900 [Anaerolineae bacterium CG2_30_64_16]|nr:MAG: hypothetical protein AUK03_16900 [Anaerolineae bacterium CG2_30_64_16]